MVRELSEGNTFELFKIIFSLSKICCPVVCNRVHFVFAQEILMKTLRKENAETEYLSKNLASV